MKRMAVAALTVLVIACSVQAAPIVDYFDYGTTQRDLGSRGAADGGWAGPWVGSGSSNDTDYMPTANLTYTDGYYSAPDNLPTTGGVGNANPGYVPRRSFTTPLADSIWMSALINNAGGLAYVYLESSVSNKNVFGLNGNKPTIRYNGTSDIQSTRTLAAGVHLLLAKIVVNAGGNDTLSLWVDPNLSGGEATLGTPDVTRNNADVYGDSLTDVGMGVTYSQRLDALRIGATLSEVTVPEPATLVLLALGGLAAVRRRV